MYLAAAAGSADQPLTPDTEDDTQGATIDLPENYEGDASRLILCEVFLESHQPQETRLLFLQTFGANRLITSNIPFETDKLTGIPSCEVMLKPGVAQLVAFLVEPPSEDEDD
jgi:hypothetical protein